MKSMITFFPVILLVAVGIVAAQQNLPVNETESQPVAELNEPAPPVDAIPVSLSQNGELSGTVYRHENGNQKAVVAKVTISKLNGDSIAAGMTREDGKFTFDSIEPGFYTVIGIGSGYYGDQVIDVRSHDEVYTTTVAVQVADGFDTNGVYTSLGQAPLSNFSSSPIQSDGQFFQQLGPPQGSQVFYGGTTQVSSGGTGSLGRRRFRGRGIRRLLPLIGLVGLTAINNDDDASPTM